MKNANLSVSDAIRYLVVGIQPLLIISIQSNYGTLEGINFYLPSHSGVFILTISFLSGLLIYSLYKPLIADYFIAFIQDMIRYSLLPKYPNFHNQRTFIKKIYGISKYHVRTPQLFWFYLSPHLKHHKNRNAYLIKQSSIIHLLYQTTLICGFAIYLIDDIVPILHTWLSYIGWSSLLMGLIYDGFVESLIYRFLKGMVEDKRDDCAREFGLI